MNLGAVAHLARVRVDGARDIGMAATDEGELYVEDALVRNVAPAEHDITGWGIAAAGRGRLEARRVVVADCAEGGAVAVGPASLMLEDVLVSDVVPSSRGFGVGIAAFGAGVEATRVSVDGAAGGGAVATPLEWREEILTGRLWIADAWIHGVGTSTVGLSADGSPAGRPAAYGLHVGAGCGLQAERFVVDGAGYGVFASQATTILRTGVISGQLDAAGAVSPDPESAELHTSDLSFIDNAVDEIVAAPGDLPAAAALPEPSPICVEGCD